MSEVTPGRISLTADWWTSISTDGYLCVTAHFIDKEWKLHKRVRSFQFMPPPHSGVNLAEMVSNILYCLNGELKKKIIYYYFR